MKYKGAHILLKLDLDILGAKIELPGGFVIGKIH
jgi:hypothetical protein